ncbi:MAG TPA: hypothetical protein VJR46_11710 [Candidatus Dormibacteraeota bacterium]|nr:hypothetical protein [Candidatus Dormibacteraeota bacterium]
MGSDNAWEKFESDIRGLAGELKRHYRNAGNATDEAEVKRSLDQLRQAADSVFRSVESTTRDPEVKSKTKEAARSFGLAVAETFRDLSDEIEKAARRP